MYKSFKYKAISAAIMTTLISLSAQAEEEVTKVSKDKKKDIEEIEVIEVTGFAGSLRKAMNSKRFSENVMDSIHAEDIGKSTDQNIADALSRVTGVTVQEADGEGTRISVRGAGANLNQISLNGVALTSGLGGDADNPAAEQAVDLSAFSSDILSSIDVIKTASADHDEGSLGANVILRTVKPLNLNKPRRSIDFQQRYNAYSGDNDGKITLNLSDKFFDDTFGINFLISNETQKTRRDSYYANWSENAAYVKAGSAKLRGSNETNPEDTYAFDINYASQALNLNERNRKTANLGLQYQPSGDTDIQLDLSYSKQELRFDNHNINLTPGVPNIDGTAGNANHGWEFDEGTQRLRSDNGQPSIDPQPEWWTLDPESHTLVRSLNRSSDGGLGRSIGGNDIETKVATFKVNHIISDDLTVDLTVGYSKTTDNTIDNMSLTTASWGIINPSFVNNWLTEDLEPGGYDCTTDICGFEFASQFASVSPTGVPDRTSATSRFNPFDLNTMHVGTLRIRDNIGSDTNKSLFLDFDWDVDFFDVVTKIEFGAKYSNRLVDVYSNIQRVTDDSVQLADPNTGAPIASRSANEVLSTEFIDPEAFPVDNFMDGLVPNREQNYLKGWGLLNPFEAFDAVFADPNASLKPNEANSRVIEQDSKAIYAKVKFEFLDGRLTGDIGIRMVRDEVNASSATTVNFQTHQEVFDPWGLVTDYKLANTDLPACQPDIYTNWTDPLLDIASVINGDATVKANPNVDGNNFGQCSEWGFMFNHSAPGAVRNRPLTNNGFYDPSILFNNDEHFLQIQYDANGNVVTDLTGGNFVNSAADVFHNSTRSNWWLRRWGDPSTNATWQNQIVEQHTNPDAYDETHWAHRVNPDIVAAMIEDENLVGTRRFPTSDSATHTYLLPSLNLNYQISDEVISRFAVSKTMARPRFDSLRPGVVINEANWGEFSGGSAFNTRLKALESKNLDLSFEWYFNGTNMVSLALFNKDMKNFEERIVETFIYKDIRTDYLRDSISKDELLLVQDGSLNPSNSGCMPNRVFRTQLKEAWDFECDQVNVGVLRNGAGATTKGIELGYNQVYDFLPGALSGLGFNFNYTFQNSETDLEISENTGLTLKPLPQAYTPRHSANSTLYWEHDGWALRLSHRYNGTQLVNRGLARGVIWQEATNRLDFNANYTINKNVSLSFHALNLTDDITRQYYTSASTIIGQDSDGVDIELDEGNAITDDVEKGRTTSLFKTGVNYRLNLRINF